MVFMNRAWKTVQPNRNPSAHSHSTSAHIGIGSWAVMTAAARMPIPSPATQCIVEPTTCRHFAATYSSRVPGSGSRQLSTHSNAPNRPLNAVTITKPRFMTTASGVVWMSMATNATALPAWMNHSSITPSSNRSSPSLPAEGSVLLSCATVPLRVLAREASRRRNAGRA